MTAIYLTKAQKLHFGDVALNDPLVMIKACGVCQSDFKAFSNPPANMLLPRILGHEIVGTVSKDIPEDGLCKGDRVALWPAFCCGGCHYCKGGQENLCPDIEVFGYHVDGGFQAGLACPKDKSNRLHLHKIPEKVSFEEAVFAEPLACVVNALEKVSFSPRSCLVVGAGVMGRLALRTLQSMFQAKTFVCDVDEWRQLQAESECQKSQSEEADLVFMAASTGAALEYGLKHLAPGGTILLFSGIDRSGNMSFSIPHNKVHQKEQCLVGAYGCAPHHLQKALKLIGSGVVKVSDLISCKVELAELPQVLKEKSFDHYKTIVMMSNTL